MEQKTSSIKEYFDRIIEIINSVNTIEINSILQLIKFTISNKGNIFILGNGGSATTASHFANDLNTIAQRRGILIKSIALTDNIASITAIANDESFDLVFSRQLNGKLTDKDLLFCISASGNSVNLINAVNYAKSCSTKSVSLVGFDGGVLGKISTVACCVPTNKGEYGPTEDIHLAICHFLAQNC